MNDCPPIETLLAEELIQGSLAAHVARCEACHAIVTLKVFRGLPDRPDTRDGCDAAVDAIAALADGVLDELGHRRLAVHLAGCAACRETAIRVSFFKDELDDVPEPVTPPAPAPAVAARATGEPSPQPPEGRGRLAAIRDAVLPHERGFRWPHLAAAAMVGAVTTAGALRALRAVPALPPPAVATAHLAAPGADERAEIEAERARLAALRAEVEAQAAKVAADRAELAAQAAKVPAPPTPEAPKRRGPPHRR
jgi:hypothetical protein